MPLEINVPTTSNATSFVSLGGENYKFDFFYSDRTQRYSLDISLGDESIIRGLVMIENSYLTGKYDLPSFSHGELWTLQARDTSDPLGRNNFGVDKAYELVYYTNEELTELGIV